MNFFDEYGGLHHTDEVLNHNGNFAYDKTSENAPMYTGLWITLRFFNGKITQLDCERFLDYVDHLVRFNKITNKWDWKTTPGSKSERFSRDNWQGIFSGINCIERHARRKMHLGEMDWENISDQCWHYKSLTPLFHKQFLHPRTLQLAWEFKLGPAGRIALQLFGMVILTLFGMAIKLACPWGLLDLMVQILTLFTCALWVWIVELDAIWSCYTTLKERNGNIFYKTDGKLIALMTTISFKMGGTFDMCHRGVIRYRKCPPPPQDFPVGDILNDEWSWCSWRDIALYYFRGKKDHPIVEELSDD